MGFEGMEERMFVKPKKIILNKNNSIEWFKRPKKSHSDRRPKEELFQTI